VWQPGVSIVQPALAADGDILVTSGDAMGGNGIRRLAVARGPAGSTVEERWTSRGLKPYFNDFVVHEGHAFGFDGSILASIDLSDSTRKWKGGRYGHGQLVLLPDQDVLLVLSEEGELALVQAAPDQFTELARSRVLDGKTWHHPVLVGDVLLVRNGEEMAAFRLPRSGCRLRAAEKVARLSSNLRSRADRAQGPQRRCAIVSKSSAGRSGFDRYASIPASRHRSLSLFIACAVKATIGTAPPCSRSCARMAAAASRPSMSGI
jgi:hypothetical protein